ncbi:MAG TPA: PIN domain-containing protein [Tepidisphaeraceae bacterium]
MNVEPAIFLDTAFLIALLEPRDEYHKRALAWQRVAAGNQRYITTEAVLWELLNFMSGMNSRRTASEFYHRIHADSTVEVIPWHPPSMRLAIDLYASRSDKQWSLTDCLSFVVMQQHGLAAALTSDHHFTQAGFEALLLRQPS